MNKLIVLLFFVFTQVNSFEISIKNVAKATYEMDYQKRVSFSNEVETLYKKESLKYQLEFFRYSFDQNRYINITNSTYTLNNSLNGEFFSNSLLHISNQTLNPIKILPTIAEYIKNKKDPIIVVLKDKRANRVSTKKESLKVSVDNNQFDKEVIKLYESENDSGIFIGYIIPTTNTFKKSVIDNMIYVYSSAKITMTPKLFYVDLKEIKKFQRSLIITPSIKELADIESNDKKQIWISHKSISSNMEVGSYTKFDVEIKNLKDTTLDNFKVVIKLPKSLKYISSSFDNTLDVSFDDSLLDQNILIFHVKDLKDEILSMNYIALSSIDFNKESTISAWCSKDDKLISNIQTQTIYTKKPFLKDKGFILGKIKTDDSVGLKNIRVYLDNGTYAVSDNDGKFHFAGLENRTYVLQIDKDSLNALDIVSCSDFSKQGSLSKFVDLEYARVKTIDFCAKLKDKNTTQKEIKKFKIRAKKSPKMPKYTLYDLKDLNISKILWPPKKFNPPISSIKVAISHKVDEILKLFINGKEVDMLNYDTKISSKDFKFQISIYRGVDLEVGDNLLEAKIYSKKNQLLSTIKQKVHLSSTPVRAEILKEHSYLVADGKNPIVIAVRLYDALGYPVSEDMQGVFKLQEPYHVQSTLDRLNINPLVNRSTEDKYIVYGDGISYIYIAPTTKAQEAKLHFKFANSDQLLRVWIKPKPRDWIFVGFVEGSIGYKRLKQNLNDTTLDEPFYSDGKLSFFAKGKIRGDLLLTIAYDSSKDKDIELFDSIDPNEYYTIYQDSSTNDYEAQSQKKLYLKIEKEQFYALFGDINTDLEVNKLSKYQRSLNGFKSEYSDKNFSYKIFISDSKNLFVKDEIRADGTSGPYHLTNKNILINSEKIFIETRDRFRQEIITQRVPMRRFFDYSIDYNEATIYFKEPIFSTDFSANPKFIIIDYEIKSDTLSNLLYGGRFATKFYKRKIESGISYIKEDLKLNKKTLQAIDTKIKLLNNLQLNIEYAKTNHLINSQNITGDAYLLEAIYHSNILKSTGYFRNQNDSFGMEQENQLYRHSQKIGLDSRVDYFKRVAILMSAYRDKDLLNDTKEDSAALNFEYKKGYFVSLLGYKYTLHDKEQDRRFIASVKDRFLQNRLSLNLSQEYSLDNYKRVQLKTKYALNSLVDLFILSSITDEKNQKILHNTLGVQSSFWNKTDIKASIINSYQNDQQAIFSKLGFTKAYQLSETLTLMGGIEQRDRLRGESDELQEEFKAYTTALNFNKKPWNSNLQLQLRDSKSEKKVIVDLALYNQLNSKTALSSGARYNFIKKKQETIKKLNTNLSGVYRPLHDWLILNRLDFNYLVDLENKNTTLINTILLANKPYNNLELSLSYGLKYIQKKLDNSSFSSITDLMSINSIFNLNSKYDLGVHFGALQNYASNQTLYTYGAELGYMIVDDALVGFGYNLKGFSDRDFKIQNYTNQGIYIRVRVKFDQVSLRDILDKL